jgi:tetratricopeptide (TPR) repeat protein
MKNRFTYCAIAVYLLFLFFSACSTQKNTWSSRCYHGMTTKYNIYFNGYESYKSGIKQLQNSHKEDYSKLLPVYIVSNHENAKNAASAMNRSIEKCQKAIKNHSIRVKPKNKPNPKSSEEKKLFYSKEEFNPFMNNVFLLMANSQFYKTDFLSANSTCSYILRHFSTDKETYDKASILMARSNIELEWYYEAENILNKLNKENLMPSLTGDFSSAYADLLIHRKRYSEAIPYLEIAIKKASHKIDKYRWNFLLAQLYEEIGKADQAYKLFSTIPNMNPPYEMELSARIQQTEVYPESNPKKPLKKLIKLSHNSKNTDFLDQVYYAMGNLYFAARDTLKAVESFHSSLKKSAKNNPYRFKAESALGNYYYNTEQFILAEPCYTEAVSMLKKEDDRFEDISQRAEILKTLAPQLKIIQDEDSLQAIAKMPEKERNEIISKLIEAAEKTAKEEARKKSIEKALNTNKEQLNENINAKEAPKNTNSVSDINTDKSWYFYNSNTINKGLTEFKQKWGKRSLNDDWQRDNKTAAFENATADSATKSTDGIISKAFLSDEKPDTTKNVDSNLSEESNDPLKANYYLKNLPFTEEQLTTSNNKIAEALYNTGVIYREQMENDKLALKTFRELENRFPNNPLLEKSYYITYLMLKQQKRDAEADIDRNKQISLFPGSPLAKRLKDPLFIEKMIEMNQVQDTLYAKTYQWYLQHKTDSIFNIGRYVEEIYPVNSLIPKFTFLQAMESARIGRPNDFHKLLTDITKSYPKSDLIPIITQMLVYWDQGLRPVPSSGFTNLLQEGPGIAVDSLARLDSLSKQFQFNPAETHYILINYPASSTNINRLQFDVALYNFTNFLIRDYELSFAKVGKMDVLLISGFENAEDVMRYRSWIVFQNQKPEEKYPGIQFIMISASNLKLLQEGVSPEKYLDFFKKNYSGIKPNP